MIDWTSAFDVCGLFVAIGLMVWCVCRTIEYEVEAVRRACADPVCFARDVLGVQVEPWQATALRNIARSEAHLGNIARSEAQRKTQRDISVQSGGGEIRTPKPQGSAIGAQSRNIPEGHETSRMNTAETQRKTQRSEVRTADADVLYDKVVARCRLDGNFYGSAVEVARKVRGVLPPNASFRAGFANPIETMHVRTAARVRDYVVAELDKEFAERMVAERAEWGKTASVLEREAIRGAVQRLAGRYSPSTRGLLLADLDRCYPSLKPKPKLEIAALQLRDGSFWRHRDDPTTFCGCGALDCPGTIPGFVPSKWFSVASRTDRALRPQRATVPPIADMDLSDVNAVSAYGKRIEEGKKALAAGDVTL